MPRLTEAVFGDGSDYVPFEELCPSLPLEKSEGWPLQSIWHRDQVSLLIGSLRHHWRDRDDFFVGGNTFVYYCIEQARDILDNRGNGRAFRGPDFFYVSDVPRDSARRFWVVWEEDGRYPNLIIDFVSPGMTVDDREKRKQLYSQVFRTCEYFLFDPETGKLEGWRLNSRYERIPLDKRRQARSIVLGLRLGTWSGKYLGGSSTWLRFFDAKSALVPLAEEAAEAEIARLKAKFADATKKKNGR